jgi:hypothetical protein
MLVTHSHNRYLTPAAPKANRAFSAGMQAPQFGIGGYKIVKNKADVPIALGDFNDVSAGFYSVYQYTKPEIDRGIASNDSGVIINAFTYLSSQVSSPSDRRIITDIAHVIDTNTAQAVKFLELLAIAGLAPQPQQPAQAAAKPAPPTPSGANGVVINNYLGNPPSNTPPAPPPPPRVVVGEQPAGKKSNIWVWLIGGLLTLSALGGTGVCAYNKYYAPNADKDQPQQPENTDNNDQNAAQRPATYSTEPSASATQPGHTEKNLLQKLSLAPNASGGITVVAPNNAADGSGVPLTPTGAAMGGSPFAGAGNVTVEQVPAAAPPPVEYNTTTKPKVGKKGAKVQPAPKGNDAEAVLVTNRSATSSYGAAIEHAKRSRGGDTDLFESKTITNFGLAQELVKQYPELIGNEQNLLKVGKQFRSITALANELKAKGAVNTAGDGQIPAPILSVIKKKKP